MVGEVLNSKWWLDSYSSVTRLYNRVIVKGWEVTGLSMICK